MSTNKTNITAAEAKKLSKEAVLLRKKNNDQYVSDLKTYVLRRVRVAAEAGKTYAYIKEVPTRLEKQITRFMRKKGYIVFIKQYTDELVVCWGETENIDIKSKLLSYAVMIDLYVVFAVLSIAAATLVTLFL